MRKLEIALCVLLSFAGVGHLAGTLAGYEPGTEVFVWSLSATAFVFTVAFLHLLRLRRPGDRLIAGGAAVATALWIVLALLFGSSVGAITDPRVLIHVAVSAALLAASLRDLRAGRPMPSPAG